MPLVKRYLILFLLALGCGKNSGTSDASVPDAMPDGSVQIPPALGLEGLVAGGFHTCAWLENNTIQCWGWNNQGQLGLGDATQRGMLAEQMGDNLPVVDLGSDESIVAVGAGATHTCVVFEGGIVKCWGGNPYGELGVNDKENRGDQPGEMGLNLPPVDLGTNRRALAIGVGELHACVLLDDETVKCWGNNFAGQLGLGDTENRGDEPNETGQALPVVDLGADRKALTLAAGNGHTCALLDNQTVKCWGSNDRGQLGLGDSNDRGDDANEMGDSLPIVALGNGARAIALAAGATHSCALLATGQVKCWGGNGRGQLGLGDTDNRGDQPNEMGDLLPAVDLGNGSEATAIAAYGDHSCAVLQDGSAKCWGVNDHGELGLGDTNARGDEPNEMGDALPAVELGTGLQVEKIAVGEEHVCAGLTQDVIKCWGDDTHGQLGIGAYGERRGDQGREMGDALPSVYLGGRALPDRSIFVTSQETHQVLVYDMDGRFDRVFATTEFPSGLAVGPNNDIFVAGASEIKMYSIAGAVLASMPIGDFICHLVYDADSQLLYGSVPALDAVHLFDVPGGMTGPYIPAGLGGLMRPSGLIFDAQDQIHVSARFLRRIFRYSATNVTFIGESTSVAGSGPTGFQGLAIGPDGFIYVGRSFDEGEGPGDVYQYNTDGAYGGRFISVQGKAWNGMALAFDDNGDLLVSVQFDGVDSLGARIPGSSIERYDSEGHFLGHAVRPHAAGLSDPGQFAIVKQPN